MLELLRLGAAKQARLIRLGEISPVALVEAYLQQIAAQNPTLNAVVALAAETALKGARAVEKKLARGEDPGPLGGVPFVVKDTFDTAGVRSAYGSTAFQDNVPLKDAHAVRRLKAAGALLLGKTNTAAFGFGLVTENDLYGATLNPWDHGVTSGGSSGGDAVAVAANLAPLALGSDLIGSIRIPAHCNGVVGYRPTPGLLSAQGHSRIGTPVLAELVAAGFTARHVEDIAVALGATAGYNFLDPFSRASGGGGVRAGEAPSGSAIARSSDALSGVRALARILAAGSPSNGEFRCAVLDFGDALVPSPAVAAALADAARALTGRVNRAPLQAAGKLYATMGALVGAGLADAISRQTGGTYDMDPRLSLVPHWDHADMGAFLEAVGCRMEMTVLARALLERFEILVLPVLPTVAPAHASGDTERLLGQAIANYLPVLAGLPALSVPVARADGLPINVQIVGRPGADATVLRAGAQLQRMFQLG